MWYLIESCVQVGKEDGSREVVFSYETEEEAKREMWRCVDICQKDGLKVRYACDTLVDLSNFGEVEMWRSELVEYKITDRKPLVYTIGTKAGTKIEY